MTQPDEMEELSPEETADAAHMEGDEGQLMWDEPAEDGEWPNGVLPPWVLWGMLTGGNE